MQQVLDPIKTMKKDVLPRFLASEVYDDLINNLTTLDPMPIPVQLEVIPPADDTLLRVHAGAPGHDEAKDAGTVKAAADITLDDVVRVPSRPSSSFSFALSRRPP